MSKIEGEKENPSFKVDIMQTAMKVATKKIQTMAASGPVDFGAALKKAFSKEAPAPKPAPTPAPSSKK